MFCVLEQYLEAYKLVLRQSPSKNPEFPNLSYPTLVDVDEIIIKEEKTDRENDYDSA